MAETSSIEWTDATWNPITGCSVVSPGCTNCYAMRVAARLERMLPGERRGHLVLPNHYAGLTEPSRAGPVWTGRVNLAPDKILSKPLRWRKPRRIFVNSMSDLFHESVPDAWIDRVFAVMALCPQHTFQVLTKRAAGMRKYLTAHDSRRADSLGSKVIALGYEGPLECLRWPLPNVWLGISVEDQTRADERIPDLLATPAAVRFVSAEPLLGAVDLGPLDGLDWVICGGESGPGARPMHPDWARGLRDQCVGAGVPFFFKQWGEFAPRYVPGTAEADPPSEVTPRAAWHDACGLIRDTLSAPDPLAFWCEGQVFRVGKRRAGRLLDGRTWDEMPGAANG